MFNYSYIVIILDWVCILALDIMEAQEDSGPLHPKHLREAVRRLRKTGAIPSSKGRKLPFYI